MLSLASGALATVVLAWTRAGLPGTYGLDIIASEATLRLALDPDFVLSGVSRGQPVELRAAGAPLAGRCAGSWTRSATVIRARWPAGRLDAAATLAVAVAAEQALRTARAVPVENVV